MPFEVRQTEKHYRLGAPADTLEEAQGQAERAALGKATVEVRTHWKRLDSGAWQMWVTHENGNQNSTPWVVQRTAGVES